MLHDILLAVWFFLPIGAANASPVVASRLPVLKRWNAPIDGGRHLRGTRLLGSHKTWRGVASGAVVATLVFWLQQYLAGQWEGLAGLTAPIDYTVLPVLIVGPLFGIGTLGGDAVKSFFKRRRGIPAGHSWFPFDQLDILGGAVLVAPFIILSFTQYVWLIAVCLAAHLLFAYLGYLAGFKERPI